MKVIAQSQLQDGRDYVTGNGRTDLIGIRYKNDPGSIVPYTTAFMSEKAIMKRLAYFDWHASLLEEALAALRLAQGKEVPAIDPMEGAE